MQVPTVKIEGEKGDYIVINTSDFDEKKHKLFARKQEKAKVAKDARGEQIAGGENLALETSALI